MSRRDVPGQVAAALEAMFALVQVDAKAAISCRDAGPVGYVVGWGRSIELRAFLELVVVEVAGPTGQRQHLRDDVEIHGGEERRLPVTALHVLAERRVGVLAQAAIGGIVAGNGSDRGHAARSAGLESRQIGRITLRNGQVVEVHLILDGELLPVTARPSRESGCPRWCSGEFRGSGACSARCRSSCRPARNRRAAWSHRRGLPSPPRYRRRPSRRRCADSWNSQPVDRFYDPDNCPCKRPSEDRPLCR